MLRYDLTDQAAFAGAYREHRARAFAAANGVLRDAAAAEDVVQEVFLQLWSRPQAFDESRGSLGTYVAVMARSRAIDVRRARRARDAATERAAHAEPAAPARDTTAERAISADLSSRALRVLEQLPAEQRDVMLLNYGRGLTVPEIARLTGVSLGTAKSRVRLGLRRTRALLEPAA
jgi:RNA polymerase sigma-70 factor (ECF subfamily)